MGHSFGAFTAPLVADRLAAELLVLVAGMIPAPGESPNDWWHNTGYNEAVRAQAARDGGLTGSSDPYVSFYHDIPRELAEEALGKERAHPSQASMEEPWPLDAWPNVPTRIVLCSEDRFFPPDFFRRLAAERLGIVPDEIAASHGVALSRPKELADILESFTPTPATPDRPHGQQIGATWQTIGLLSLAIGARAARDRSDDRQPTYGEFAKRVQPGYAPIGTGAILGDIGYFCNTAGWPNVTCFVISATTGECSEGFTLVSDEDPAVARDGAWLAYAVYKTDRWSTIRQISRGSLM